MSDNSGKIWMVVRDGLRNRRERILAAYDSKSYEAESAQLDQLAREITTDIQRITDTATKGPKE